MSKARAKDRISALPDAVLYHILSFIPTKYVVRTGILSTRWKKIWASVPNLDFEFKSKNKSGCVAFVNFVDRVLYFRDSTDIQKFRLHCSYVGDYFRIDGWIRAAIMRNPVELELCVLYGTRTFELPKSLFMCKTLVVLKMKSNCITYNPPTTRCFQSLKFLYVAVENPDSDSMEKLFSCCPVLEDLTIIAGRLGRDEFLNFKVFAPVLKTLRISLHCTKTFGPYEGYKIFINAPKLEILDLKQDLLSNYIWENAKSLVKANVDLDYHNADDHDDFIDNATELLAGVSKVQYLSLAAHYIEASCVPAFDNLRELKLVLYDCYHWKLLTELLMRSPNLESLTIEHKEDNECHENHSRMHWILESVPACLISHLKTVTIRGFKGYPHEKKVAKYLLENGKVLNKMTIDTGIFKEFSFSRRGLATCQFEVI